MELFTFVAFFKQRIIAPAVGCSLTKSPERHSELTATHAIVFFYDVTLPATCVQTFYSIIELKPM